MRINRRNVFHQLTSKLKCSIGLYSKMLTCWFARFKRNIFMLKSCCSLRPSSSGNWWFGFTLDFIFQLDVTYPYHNISALQFNNIIWLSFLYDTSTNSTHWCWLLIIHGTKLLIHSAPFINICQSTWMHYITETLRNLFCAKIITI